MRRQFEALPEAMRAYLGRRVRLKNGSWSDTKRLRALRLALRLAKGYRREDYLQAIWMR
jgi:hypothetical protein